MDKTQIVRYAKGTFKWGAGSIALAAVIAWSGGCFAKKQAPGTVESAPGVPLPAGADTVTATAEATPVRIDVIGTVQSVEKVHLSSRLSAYVKDVQVSAGAQVQKGQVLVRLDDRELQEQLRAAEAQRSQAETEFNRTRKLMETGAATEQALTAARTGFDAAQAQKRQVEVMATFTEIAAPIDGVVTDRRVEIGDLANPGQVLLSVYDPVHLRVEADVPLRLLDRLPIGRDVTVQIDRPAMTCSGRVEQIVAEVDPQTRTQTVKVRLAGCTEAVLPGTFARVWIEEAVRPAVLVPCASVDRIGQLEFVRVARNGRAIRRLVRTGQVHGERVEILAGLEAGAEVLTGQTTP